MIVQHLDDLPVRLREPHDLSFLSRWGTVFRVLDEQDSGNLCFGVAGPAGRVFVKYAGAATARYDGDLGEAVARTRIAAEVHRALAHPTLVRLRESVDLDHGVALVFDWTDAVPLGRQYEQRQVLDRLDLRQRVDAVQQILDFSTHAADLGWVAVDLYDGSVMVDPATGTVTLCDLDLYERAPFTNTMGRMWGSSRFMSPEEYERGARIDHVTNVVALGSLAHTFLGADATKERSRWLGSEAHWQIAARAIDLDRTRRWPTIAALADAWRAATVTH